MLPLKWKNQLNASSKLGSGGPSWEQKSIKNRSKREVNMGRHPGIDFLWILVDFWRQVGKENGAKIDPSRHRKSDGKVDSVKIAKKSQEAVTTLCDPRGPEPWGISP